MTARSVGVLGQLDVGLHVVVVRTGELLRDDRQHDQHDEPDEQRHPAGVVLLGFGVGLLLGGFDLRLRVGFLLILIGFLGAPLTEDPELRATLLVALRFGLLVALFGFALLAEEAELRATPFGFALGLVLAVGQEASDRSLWVELDGFDVELQQRCLLVCHVPQCEDVELSRSAGYRGVDDSRDERRGMDDDQRAFLDRLLTTPSPSGFEAEGQRVWTEYVSAFADELSVDAYGNAVARVDGGGPEVVIAGHADQIGYIVRRIDDDGFLHVGPIGGSDKTVTRGQYVEVHASGESVPGVIGQAAIHLREDHEVDEIHDVRVDIGATDDDEARDLVEVGDPVTVRARVQDLHGSRLAAVGLDDRVGTWVAAEALRRASEDGTEATVCAVSTVQEEVGLRGARMVGFDLDPDAVVAVDVTHATDSPDAPGNRGGDIELGGGPVVARGSTNHPTLVEAVREAAAEAEIPVQLQATGIGTGTDADAFVTEKGGIPAMNLGLPNRYMHTPVETVDLRDLCDAADLLAAFVDRAHERDGFDLGL